MLIPCSAVAASDTVVIVVVVVDQEKVYTLHRRLLIHHSGFFRRVLTDGVNILHLRELSNFVFGEFDFDFIIDNFDVFVDWLYERSLPSCFDTTGTKDTDVDPMLSVYVLAQKLSVGSLKNTLMDSLFDWLSDGRYHLGNAEFMFEYLPGGDPLLQLAIDAFCFNDGVKEMSKTIIEWVDYLPQEFLVGVIRRMHHFSTLPEADRKLKREDYNIVECVSSEDKDGE